LSSFCPQKCHWQFIEKKDNFGHFFEKMSSFWQFFDIHMAVFRRVRFAVRKNIRQSVRQTDRQTDRMTYRSTVLYVLMFLMLWRYNLCLYRSLTLWSTPHCELCDCQPMNFVIVNLWTLLIRWIFSSNTYQL